MATFTGLWRRFLPPIVGKVLSDTKTNASFLSKINGVDFFFFLPKALNREKNSVPQVSHTNKNHSSTSQRIFRNAQATSKPLFQGNTMVFKIRLPQSEQKWMGVTFTVVISLKKDLRASRGVNVPEHQSVSVSIPSAILSNILLIELFVQIYSSNLVSLPLK